MSVKELKPARQPAQRREQDPLAPVQILQRPWRPDPSGREGWIQRARGFESRKRERQRAFASGSNPAAPIRFPNGRHPIDGVGSLIERRWLPKLIPFDSRTIPSGWGAVWWFASIQAGRHSGD